MSGGDGTLGNDECWTLMRTVLVHCDIAILQASTLSTVAVSVDEWHG